MGASKKDTLFSRKKKIIMKIAIVLLAFVSLSYAVPTPDLFVGSWKEDNTQRTGLSDYIYYRGLSWVKRIVVNTASFELTMNIVKEGSTYKVNGQRALEMMNM